MLNFIPMPYKIIGSIVLATSIIGGSVAWGYNKAENKYIAKIAQYEADAIVLQGRLDSALADVKIETVIEYVDRVKTVKEKEYVYRDKIVNVPSKCELSDGWVHIHDSSASNRDADSARSADATTSGIKDTEALGTIVGNYSICQQNAEQLIALQKWIRQAEEQVNLANAELEKNKNKLR